MFFEQNVINNNNTQNYHKENIKLARDFVIKLHEEAKDLIRGVILFGSTTKNTLTSESDIDLLVLIDDVSLQITPELSEALRIINEKIIFNISERLHVHLLPLTKYWDHARQGDPVMMNILRDGVPLVDTGFIAPMQKLLGQGIIKPSKEAVENYLRASANLIIYADQKIIQSVLDLYWSAIDSVHAYFMSLHKVPNSPEMLTKQMDQDKIFNKTDKELIRTLYAYSKDIMHNKKHLLSSKEYEELRTKTIKLHNKIRKKIEN